MIDLLSGKSATDRERSKTRAVDQECMTDATDSCISMLEFWLLCTQECRSELNERILPICSLNQYTQALAIVGVVHDSKVVGRLALLAET